MLNVIQILAVRNEPGNIYTIEKNLCGHPNLALLCMCDLFESSGEFDEHEWTYSTCVIGTKHL